MSTIFSKIIAGDAPADVVYRDDRVTCFRDIAPKAPTHILIVPNEEIPTVNDLTEAHAVLLGHMVLVAKRLAEEEGIAERGYRLVVNVNPEGGQVVYHLHMHLIGGRPLGGMTRPVG
jgi:histidine triad (HIT) family protein